LPGTVWAPFTHRSTVTGTKEAGRLPTGAWAGQPAQAGWPAVSGPPLTVGTGAADPDGFGDEAGEAGEAGEAEANVGDVVDAVGAAPPDGEPAGDVPHPAASVPAVSSAAVAAHVRGPARRADVFCVLMAVPRFSGHPLDGPRVDGGFTRIRVLPHAGPGRPAGG
jgi:hypothetical protein